MNVLNVAISALALIAVLILIFAAIELILLGIMKSPCPKCGAGTKCGCGKLSR